MNKIIVLCCTLMAAGCVTKSTPSLGMKNPASVHCSERGGKLDIVRTRQGQTGYCTLPSGERVEEWALYRRDR